MIIIVIIDGKEVIEIFEECLIGCYIKKLIKYFEIGEIFVGVDILIIEDMVVKVVKVGVEEVIIWLVFICNICYGVCCYCYGINLVIGDVVEVGEVVGIIVV